MVDSSLKTCALLHEPYRLLQTRPGMKGSTSDFRNWPNYEATHSPLLWTLVNCSTVRWSLDETLFYCLPSPQGLNFSTSQHLLFSGKFRPWALLFSTTRLDPDCQYYCRYELHFTVLNEPRTSFDVSILCV
jgi:hypothetical protein